MAKGEFMSKVAVWVVGAGVAVALTVGLAHAQALGDSIVYEDPQHKYLAFIGMPVIEMAATKSPEDLSRSTGLSPSTAASLKLHLEYTLKRTQESMAAHPGQAKVCFPHRTGFVVKGSPDKVSLSELVRQGDVTFIGQVKHSFVGISSEDVVTRLSVEVEEVLTDSSNAVRANQVLSFEQIGGSLSYKGVDLCTVTTRPKLSVGDRVLVVGERRNNPTSPTELMSGETFVLKNGMIDLASAGVPYLKETGSKPMQTLRMEIAAVANGGGHE
jgi:hypothetical protein